MSLRHTIGSAIREARILERITREELAERCDVSPYVISSIESSSCNLSIDYYNKIMSNLKYGDCYKLVKAGEPTDYWKRRCELAEKYINESPCDPDITTNQLNAWNEYQNFINTTHPES